MLAAHESTNVALLAAAAGMLLCLAAAWRWRLHAINDLDLTLAAYWPTPELHIEIDSEHVPVLVTLEYSVSPDDEEGFTATMHAVADMRRRDGAIQWGLYRDAAQPTRYVETFLAPSWLEHLRQHERGTAADRILQERIRRYVVAERPVSHLVAVDE